MGIVRTGKYLDKETKDTLYEAHARAERAPAMVIGERHLGPYGRTEVVKQRELVGQMIDKACVAAGCAEPERDADGDVIHYGVDFASGEILLWDGKP